MCPSPMTVNCVFIWMVTLCKWWRVSLWCYLYMLRHLLSHATTSTTIIMLMQYFDSGQGFLFVFKILPWAGQVAASARFPAGVAQETVLCNQLEKKQHFLGPLQDHCQQDYHVHLLLLLELNSPPMHILFHALVSCCPGDNVCLFVPDCEGLNLSSCKVPGRSWNHLGSCRFLAECWHCHVMCFGWKQRSSVMMSHQLWQLGNAVQEFCSAAHRHLWKAETLNVLPLIVHQLARLPLQYHQCCLHWCDSKTWSRFLMHCWTSSPLLVLLWASAFHHSPVLSMKWKFLCPFPCWPVLEMSKPLHGSMQKGVFEC